MMHRARAAFMLGVSWAVPWALAGVAFITWRVFVSAPRLAFPWSYWPRMAMTSALALGTLGFFAALFFAVTLRRTARGRRLEDLSLGYAARWGGTAGALSIVAMPLTGIVAWPVLVVGSAILAVIGAGSAMATVTIAQRAGAVYPAELL